MCKLRIYSKNVLKKNEYLCKNLKLKVSIQFYMNVDDVTLLFELLYYSASFALASKNVNTS